MAQPTHTKVMAAPEHRAATADFLKLLSTAARREGWRESEAFSHWLTCAASALLGPLLQLDRPAWEANEARYMAVVRSCRDQAATMGDLAKLLAITTDALETAPTDFLGPIFSEVSASAGLGQFFTPWAISMASASMILQDAPALLADIRAEGGSHITLSEPACGVGGMVLAGNEVLRGHGICPATQAHWVAVDVDWRAVCGAYVQLTLTGCSAVVVHGNCLSAETWAQLPTVAAVAYPKRRARLRAQTPPDQQVGDGRPAPIWTQADLFA